MAIRRNTPAVEFLKPVDNVLARLETRKPGQDELFVQRFMPTVPARRKKATAAGAAEAANGGMDDKSFAALLKQACASFTIHLLHAPQQMYSQHMHCQGLKMLFASAETIFDTWKD